MSKFENYTETSSSYDKEREPVGADVIAGLLHVHAGKPLKDLHVLDAGCGTGNYTKALIKHGVDKVTLLDACAEMLNKARDKLRDAIDQKVIENIVEAKMPPLPFDDGSFDVVLFSAVLHHLDDTANGKDFPIIEETLREAKRVLRQNGVMIIADALPYSLREASWIGQLDTKLMERFSKLFPSVTQYKEMLEKNGFQMVSKLNILGSELVKNYFDPEGPLKKEWRNGLSVFGLATEKEILNIEQRVRKMNEDGTMVQFMKEHDKVSQIGTLAILACVSL